MACQALHCGGERPAAGSASNNALPTKSAILLRKTALLDNVLRGRNILREKNFNIKIVPDQNGEYINDELIEYITSFAESLFSLIMN